MRLLFCCLVPVALTTLAVACDTVDPSECWLNTSGGLGGGGTVPIGAGVGVSSGDFLTPPSSHPLDAPAPANPCVIAPMGCDAQCLASYEAAAGECGMIADDAQRKTCQDAAYATYKNCEGSCHQADAADCLEKCKQMCDKQNQRCIDNCPKGSKACFQKCNEEMELASKTVTGTASDA